MLRRDGTRSKPSPLPRHHVATLIAVLLTIASYGSTVGTCLHLLFSLPATLVLGPITEVRALLAAKVAMTTTELMCMSVLAVLIGIVRGCMQLGYKTYCIVYFALFNVFSWLWVALVDVVSWRPTSVLSVFDPLYRIFRLNLVCLLHSEAPSRCATPRPADSYPALPSSFSRSPLLRHTARRV